MRNFEILETPKVIKFRPIWKLGDDRKKVHSPVILLFDTTSMGRSVDLVFLETGEENPSMRHAFFAAKSLPIDF